LQSVAQEEHKYTCELNKEWTPFNSNLHMQGIKVRVNNPIPETSRGSGSFEDTMMLLDMMKDKKQKEQKTSKDELIREMAMQQKRKQEEKQRTKVFKASF